MKPLNAWLGSTGDEVCILTDERTYLLPARQIHDSRVFESLTIPHWWHAMWKTSQSTLKTLGLSMKKTSRGWTIRFSDRGNTAPTDAPDTDTDAPASVGNGNTSAESDYHAWLARVDASMPPAVPA